LCSCPSSSVLIPSLISYSRRKKLAVENVELVDTGELKCDPSLSFSFSLILTPLPPVCKATGTSPPPPPFPLQLCQANLSAYVSYSLNVFFFPFIYHCYLCYCSLSPPVPDCLAYILGAGFGRAARPHLVRLINTQDGGRPPPHLYVIASRQD
jgi:hypothetical protein